MPNSLSPTLSIVIVTYNRGHLLPRAVNSVISQLRTNDQLIVVDDGSTDSTSKYLKNLKKRMPRVTLIFHSHNLGVQHARNSGIKAATGSWTCFLDSDDYYLPKAIKIIKTNLSKVTKDIGVVQFMLHSTRIRNGSHQLGYLPKRPWHHYRPSLEDTVLKRHFIGDMHRVIRTSVSQKHLWSLINPGHETYHYAQLASQGVHFLYINQSVVMVDESDSNSHSYTRFSKYPDQHIKLFQRFLEQFTNIFTLHHYQKSIYQFYIGQCYLYKRQYLHSFLWYFRGLISRINS